MSDGDASRWTMAPAEAAPAGDKESAGAAAWREENRRLQARLQGAFSIRVATSDAVAPLQSDTGSWLPRCCGAVVGAAVTLWQPRLRTIEPAKTAGATGHHHRDGGLVARLPWRPRPVIVVGDGDGDADDGCRAADGDGYLVLFHPSPGHRLRCRPVHPCRPTS